MPSNGQGTLRSQGDTERERSGPSKVFSRPIREGFSVDRVRERNCARPLSRDPEGGRNGTPETHRRDRGNDRGSGHAGRRGDRRRVRPERRRRAATRARQARTRASRRRSTTCVKQMTLDEKLHAAPARRGLADHGRPGQGRPRRGLQPHRPGEDQPPPARRGGAVAAAHPDPVRLRHDPRLPHGVPDPARRGEQLRPVGGHRRRHDRRARDGDGRDQADLQPDGRRLARAPLGPDRRGRRRGPVPRLGVRGRPGQGRAGRRLLRARQGRRRAPSTSPRTASPRAGASTTRRTCPSSGCGTCTCRRSRPRSTPARTP